MNGRRIYQGRGKFWRFQQHQRHDLPTRESTGLRTLGGRSRDGGMGLRPLPAIFQKMENCLAGGDDFRGDSDHSKWKEALLQPHYFRLFSRQSNRQDSELTNDVNGFRQEGFAAFDKNVFRGRRLSAARAYLHPVMNRPNLEVICRAHALCIRFEETGPWCGFHHKGQTRSVQGENHQLWRRLQSPQLLQLSGIGNPEDLEPSVSKSFKNSREWGKTCRTIWRCMCSTLAPSRFRCSLLCVGGINLGSVFNGFSFGRPAATNHFEAGGFQRSNDQVAYPNLMFHFLPLAIRYDGTSPTGGHGYKSTSDQCIPIPVGQ